MQNGQLLAKNGLVLFYWANHGARLN